MTTYELNERMTFKVNFHLFRTLYITSHHLFMNLFHITSHIKSHHRSHQNTRYQQLDTDTHANESFLPRAS